MGVRILKTGKRMGALGSHAVVQVGTEYRMYSNSNGRWICFLKGPVCPEVKRHFLNQIF